MVSHHIMQTVTASLSLGFGEKFGIRFDFGTSENLKREREREREREKEREEIETCKNCR